MKTLSSFIARRRLCQLVLALTLGITGQNLLGNDYDPFLVARYDFENTNNPYADSSGNNNNPDEIYEGSTNDTFSTNAAVGQYARLFFGDSDFAFDQSVPAYNNLSNALTGNFSVTAWVNTTNTEGADYNNAAYGAPVFFGASDYNNHCTAPMSITGSKVGFSIISSDGPGTVTIHSTTSVNDGNYHFLAVTRQQTNGLMSIYVDGSLQATGTGITNPVITQGWIAVGGGNSYYYAGLMDDVRIYSTNLSAGDVVDIYTNPGSTTTLAASIGAPNLPTSTSGDSDWFVESTNTYNGDLYAAQSGSVTGNQSSTLSVTVTGPGTLTYYWSSIANDLSGGFSCEFDVDGNYSNNISGDTAWYQDGPYSIGPGQHILSWTANPYGDTDPTEAGYLDDVSYIPTVSPALTVTASPQSGLPPLTVQFTSPAVDGNGNTVTNWYWTFGDGGTSTAQSPSHIYTSIGSYSPSLTAYSTFGSTPLSVTGPGTITVTPPPPPTGNWTTTGAIGTSERFAFPLTVLPNGEVLASGGQAVFEIATSFESDLYNPTNGTWQPTTGYMNYARQNHTTTLLTNGLVLAAGGVTVGAGGQTVSACELYNPATGLWTTTGTMKTARYSHTAVLLTNGVVLVAGGISNSVTLASAELYNPAAGTWTSTGNLNTPRSSASAFLLTNGTVLIVGGQGASSTTLSSAEIYNPGTGLWRYTTSPMLMAQYQPICQLLPDGQVLAAGGLTNGTAVSGFCELYSPASDSWSQTGSMNTPREAAGSVLLKNGIVLVAGGDNGSSGNYMTISELYDPAGGFWTVTGAMKEGRGGAFPMVLLATGQALATGGFPANNDLSTGTTELYTTTVPTIRILNPTRLAGGVFQFSFTNTPGAGSTVFTTTNLGLSLPNWTTLGSATEVSPGQFQFTDPQATNNSKRFYRVRSP